MAMNAEERNKARGDKQYTEGSGVASSRFEKGTGSKES